MVRSSHKKSYLRVEHALKGYFTFLEIGSFYNSPRVSPFSNAFSRISDI